MASRCPGGPPSCSQGYRSARDSSAITLDFAAHTCLDDIVTEVCARQDIQSWPHVCIFSPVRLGSKGCLNAADISGCCAAFILAPVTSGWRHEPPGVLPGSWGFLVPHRRQTVALLSSLYILNVLHFNKTNTEVMGLVAFLSMMLVPYHSMSSQLKRMQTLNLKATSQLLLFFHLRRSAKIKPFIKAAFSGSNPQLCCIQAGLQSHTLWWS